mmetsp:Transcript_56312/g.134368  ORF Transcript_56312/g.134368 Transcript_56312/m.134368 type:complete len:452 (-) Transcript_56312:134-1489(-)
MLTTELADGQVLRLVSSASQQAKSLVFRVHRASAKQLRTFELDPALKAFNLEIVDDQAPPMSFGPQPQTCLRIQRDRSVDGKGFRGPWATFVVSARDESGPRGVSLRSVGHVEEPAFLADGGEDFVASASSDDPASRWLFQSVHVPRPFEDFDLTPQQYEAFARCGFMILKGAVPTEYVNGALRYINHLIGQGPDSWVVDLDSPTEPGEPPKLKLPSSRHPSIEALVTRTCLGVAVQRLLQSPFGTGGAQLAVRFPVTDLLESVDGKLTEAAYKVVHRDDSTEQFHIDGTGRESPLPFSVLLKVALSDQTSQHCGNFTVFPASHRNSEVIRWYFGQISATKGVGTRAEAGAGQPPKPPKPAIGPPLQLQLAPGDAVLAHPYLCHRPGTNTSAHIRYSAFFRFRSKNFAKHAADRSALLRNPMLEFPWWGADCAEGSALEETPHKTKQQKIA